MVTVTGSHSTPFKVTIIYMDYITRMSSLEIPQKSLLWNICSSFYDIADVFFIIVPSHWLTFIGFRIPLQWRYSECNGVSNHQRLDCFLNRWLKHISKKTTKLRVTGLCAKNPPVAGGFPSLRTSNAENVSILWRHHEHLPFFHCRQFKAWRSNVLKYIINYSCSLICCGWVRIGLTHILQTNCPSTGAILLPRCQILKVIGKYMIGTTMHWWYNHRKLNESNSADTLYAW